MLSLQNKQYIMHNNIHNKSNINNNLLHNLDSMDDIILYTKNSYYTKISALKELLHNNITLHTYKDIIKFFSIIAPLNNEYALSSYNWNIDKNNNILYITNSIAKAYYDNVYKNYIMPIHNILKMSNIDFVFHEHKSKRFYKNIDIVFKIQQQHL